MSDKKTDIDEIAAVLERIAELLEAGDDNPFRIQSYRDGARTLRQTDEDVLQMAAEGDVEGLKALPDIGEGLARVIIEVVETGRSALLEQLQGRVTPVQVMQRAPGIGEELAQRIVAELGIETLEELEQAAHDGRLATVPGFGEQRVQAVRDGLAGMLSRPAQRRARQRTETAADETQGDRPPVATLLEIDAEYRRRAAAGELQRIAPRRFNPEGEAWLPIMHAQRGGWKFTVLFSNTARAHELSKTDDWVVIYYEPVKGGEERQNTVVTETSGALEGKRVVRGRAAEMGEFYRKEI